MKFRKTGQVIMALIMMISLTGCGYEMNIHITKDNTVKTTINTMFTESEMEQLAGMESEDGEGSDSGYDEYKTKEYRGQTYYYETEEQERSIAEYLEDETASGADISSNHVIIRNASAITEGMTDTEEEGDSLDALSSDGTDISSLITFLDVTLSFEDEIVKTNGKLSDDKKSVWFDLLGSFKDTQCIYAFTQEYIDNTRPFAEDYTKTTNYVKSKKMTVTVCSPAKFEKADLNGKEIKLDAKETDGLFKASVKLTEGKNTLVLSNKAGETTYEMILDKTAPAIKGIENGTYAKKATFTVKDPVSGIKTVTVNGKKVNVKKCKKGYTLKEAGEYTIVVKDKAGNKATAKVTVTK